MRLLIGAEDETMWIGGVRTSLALGCVVLAAMSATAVSALADDAYSWRYYRPSNTGIQGDDNGALWISSNGDPYIAGFDPIFEEGGFARFVQAEDRWENFSNVDYPVIGHPDDTGRIRITEIVEGPAGLLWMGTMKGAMTFDPEVGASSIQRLGPSNSTLHDSYVYDIAVAPDGTTWLSNDGVVRYSPDGDTWTRWDEGNRFLSVQPKPAGGYLVWSGDYPALSSPTFVYDSETESWTVIDPSGQPGDIWGFPGQDCVDDMGNMWAVRETSAGQWPSLDYRTPDGTWVSPPEPYASFAYDPWAFRALGDTRALLVDGNSVTWWFDGTVWHDFGQWREGAYTSCVDMDEAGNVWVCGVEGAAKRDAITGFWQRYRVTNTSQISGWNWDLAFDEATGDLYAGGNAAAGVGGMCRFDGERWYDWNPLTYGLGGEWPFDTDDCQGIVYRPSNGRIAVSPYTSSYGIHEYDGAGFVPLSSDDGAADMCEDSAGRLWVLGEYLNLRYFDGTSWTQVPDFCCWGQAILPDPDLPGTVWAVTESQLVRTDGTNTLSWFEGDFGALGQFRGVAPAGSGIAWVGTKNGLIRLDASNGDYQVFHSGNSAIPADWVFPRVVTPDGRVWMSFSESDVSANHGLCWFDGQDVGIFDAPEDGGPQWGGLPHAAIDEIEMRDVYGGYELWMSCLSRGIAVLTVLNEPAAVPDVAQLTSVERTQFEPNPFRSTTRVTLDLQSQARARVTLYDPAGRRVRTLVDEVLPAGLHSRVWDGLDDSGRAVTTGVYYARTEIGGSSGEGRVVLVR